MTEKNENRGRLEYIDPAKLELPEVRITSVFDQDVHDMFADDIKKQGVDQALLIAKDEKHLWVVDGKNRREQALLDGIKKVPCLVREMSFVDALLRNLVLNRMRGKTKASEEVMVIKELMKTPGYGVEKIVEKTGYKRDRVEKLMQISGVDEEVWKALDEDAIKVCHAFEISRLVERSTQLRVLRVVQQYKLPCTELKGVVDETLQIIAVRAEELTGKDMVKPLKVPTAECSICHGVFRVKELASVILCRNCYSVAVLSWEEAKKDYKEEVDVAKEIAEKVAGGGESEG